MDFDVSIPNFEKDYFGVELFLKNYLNGESYDFAQLTELVLGDEQKDEPNPLTSIIKIPYYDNDGTTSSVEEQEQQSVAESEKLDNKKTSNSTANSSASSNKKKSSNKSSSSTSGSDGDAMTDDTSGDPAYDGPLEGDWDWSSDTYGVLTVLDYKVNRKLNCMKQIKNYVLSVTPEKQKSQVTEIFDEGRIGILINERVINMPIEFGPTLHENLHSETHEECKKNGTWFKYFFILSKIYFQKNVADTTGQQKKTKVEPIFQKPEEAYYYSNAVVKFTFPLKYTYTYDSNAVGMEYNIERQGVAMFVDAKHEKVQKILSKMKKELTAATVQTAI